MRSEPSPHATARRRPGVALVNNRAWNQQTRPGVSDHREKKRYRKDQRQGNSNSPSPFHAIPLISPSSSSSPRYGSPPKEPPNTRCPLSRNTRSSSSSVASAIRSIVGQYATACGLHFAGRDFSPTGVSWGPSTAIMGVSFSRQITHSTHSYFGNIRGSRTEVLRCSFLAEAVDRGWWIQRDSWHVCFGVPICCYSPTSLWSLHRFASTIY